MYLVFLPIMFCKITTRTWWIKGDNLEQRWHYASFGFIIDSMW